jgi:DNA-directed RNA polymerase omega subunit
MQEFKGIDSKYRLVILAARRAKQLINGSKKKVETRSDHPLTTALEEFKQGKINFDILLEEEENQALLPEEREEVVEPVLEFSKIAPSLDDDDDDDDDEDEDEEEDDEDNEDEKDEDKEDESGDDDSAEDK